MAKKPNGSFFHDHALGLTLASLWLLSWVLQLVFQIPLAHNEAAAHGQSFQWSEFWPEFMKDTFENWQSEFLQLLTFVMLTKWFIERGSHESRDGQDEMHEDIKAIKDKIGA